ncbi:MAG TPA: chemotaxis protein CheB, partial [Acidobacteriota bacterium]|nr:chemotaxis protein CheB [Acidobacteriota bacterium]
MLDKRKRKIDKVRSRGLKVKDFLIVGIGASAGGLDAFKSLVKRLPDDNGMAFVLVQHLDPSHESSLTKIISAATKLAVVEAADGMVLEPNSIYVMPSNADISLSGYRIRLTPRSTTVPHLPVDSFFDSLAENHGANAVGVILSGTASDGTIGLKKIKSEGGITFAQDEVSAKYPGMPRSAASAGCVDYILNPEKIAAQLIKIEQRRKTLPSKQSSTTKHAKTDFAEIHEILHEATGVDFSNYRSTTIERRIRRRIMLSSSATISDYIKYLRRNKPEIDLLYRDIFIHVTTFFRDPEKFEILRSKVLPKILRNRPNEPLRIWVAGCSSGEEVYSLAITFLEFFASKGVHRELQIFASDIIESEIQKARAGVYSKAIEKYVSAKRIEKFFEKLDGGYKITKTIRELCVFAKHDLTKDPPFSRMDLISCCNVLIYLEPAMQKKVLRLFHSSLNPSGFLFLGKSESASGLSHLFEPIDKRFRIYLKRTIPTVRIPLPSIRNKERTAQATIKETSSSFDWQREADQLVLNKYKHAGFLVDERMKILAFRGMVTPFLAPVAGEASLELTKMVRKELRLDLRALLQKVRNKNTPVQKENISVRLNGEVKTVNAEAFPIQHPESDQRVFLITLQDSLPTQEKIQEGREQKKRETSKDRLISSLNQQLTQTSEDSRVSIEQLELLNEELTSTNEELQSAMEELQSSNEEYESAKEQLESANEELVTLNEELQTRNMELDQTNMELMETRDYAQAIIKTVREPLVILDSNLRIRSANDAFYRMFMLSSKEAEHAYFFDINDRQWDVPILRSQIPSILKSHTLLEDVEIERDFPQIGLRTMSLNARVLQQKGGTDPLVLLAIEDITPRKRLEEASATLLKEIHHRVKNNLQLISSLLSLQSGYIEDPKALEAFKDNKERVRSMALIHEKMYEFKQIGKISFKEYVSDLVNHLFKLYAADSKKVELLMEVEEVYLNMDFAIPCALIANELLSNALKYAFPDDRGGKIEIKLKKVISGKDQPTGKFVLSIQDNGVGFPAQIDLKKTNSMGMQIVTSLTRQLKGEIEVDR